MQVTSMNTLNELFGDTEFQFTIIEETINNYGNDQLILTVSSLAQPTSTIKINKPTNKPWKNLKPLSDISYDATVSANKDNDTYFIKPIRQSLTIQPVDNTSYSTTITNYRDLPYPPTFTVACKVVDISVANPSIIIKGDFGIHRVMLPNKAVASQIDGQLIELALTHKLHKSRLRLVDIIDSVSDEILTEMTNYTLPRRELETTYTAIDTPCIVAAEPVTDCPFTIGSGWLSIDGDFEHTIVDIEPINDGYLLWVNSPNTATYYVSSDFLELFAPKPIETNWPNGKPDQLILVHHPQGAGYITTINPKTEFNAEDYIPVSTEEALVLIYNPESEEIPF